MLNSYLLTFSNVAYTYNGKFYKLQIYILNNIFLKELDGYVFCLKRHHQALKVYWEGRKVKKLKVRLCPKCKLYCVCVRLLLYFNFLSPAVRFYALMMPFQSIQKYIIETVNLEFSSILLRPKVKFQIIYLIIYINLIFIIFKQFSHLQITCCFSGFQVFLAF